MTRAHVNTLCRKLHWHIVIIRPKICAISFYAEIEQRNKHVFCFPYRFRVSGSVRIVSRNMIHLFVIFFFFLIIVNCSTYDSVTKWSIEFFYLKIYLAIIVFLMLSALSPFVVWLPNDHEHVSFREFPSFPPCRFPAVQQNKAEQSI